MTIQSITHNSDLFPLAIQIQIQEGVPCPQCEKLLSSSDGNRKPVVGSQNKEERAGSGFIRVKETTVAAVAFYAARASSALTLKLSSRIHPVKTGK